VTAVVGEPARPRSVVARLEDQLWAFVPGRIWPRAPGFGLALADGGWLRAVPRLGLAGPVVTLLVGLFRGGWRPPAEVTYTYSLAWTCLLIAVALAGCGLAAWLWIGFVLGDLLVFQHPPVGSFFHPATPWNWLVEFLLPHLISYLLLAVLLLGTPLVALLARGTVTGLLAAASKQTRITAGVVAAAVGAAVQAALWTQAYPLLVRPLWTWRTQLNRPDPAAITPIQQHALLVGTVAALAAAGWAYASFHGLDRIRGRRYQPIAAWVPAPTRRGWPWRVAGALLRAGLTTLLLAGITPDLARGVLTWCVLVAAFCAQTLVVPGLPPARWWALRVPFGIRLVLAAVLGWLVAWLIGRTAYVVALGGTIITAQDFTPLLYAAVAAIVCMSLLLPPVDAAQADLDTGQPSGRPADGATS
jgi:hypothetical protein